MKNFVERSPIWFALGLTVAMNLLGFIVVVVGGRILGMPQIPLVFTVTILTTAIPLGLIQWLGWWEDAGFVGTTQNTLVLAVPVFCMLFALMFYGTVDKEPQWAGLYLAAAFLTALGEEALSRGLFLRAFLPRGVWQAVLIPSVLFAVQHIVQSLANGMALQENLVQIGDAFIVGILYGAVRLRINCIWPLVIVHTFNNLFFSLAGFGPPSPVHSLADIPLWLYLIRWVPSLVAAVYIVRSRVLAVTLNGQAVGEGKVRVAAA